MAERIRPQTLGYKPLRLLWLVSRISLTEHQFFSSVLLFPKCSEDYVVIDLDDGDGEQAKRIAVKIIHISHEVFCLLECIYRCADQILYLPSKQKSSLGRNLLLHLVTSRLIHSTEAMKSCFS